MIDLSTCKYIVISVMGPHAGESENEIFNRKIRDTRNYGLTFWLMKSYQAKPVMVQNICYKAIEEKTACYTMFIEASLKGGATPTKTASIASQYSNDNLNWNPIPNGISPVTGKIDNHTFALVFDELQVVGDVIDLWGYANFFNQDSPIRIMQGASTICAVKKDMRNHVEKIKSRYRNIIAVGKMHEPFCVYLK